MKQKSNSKIASGSLNLLNQEQFTITVNTKEYKCNLFGINASQEIHDFREKNPNTLEYKYDFNGDADDFQPICDLFNFRELNMSIKNIKSLLQIAEDLKINSILEKLNNYNEMYESIVQGNDIVNDLFELLTKIDTLTVDKVKFSIIGSSWIHSEENIQEFLVILFHVASNCFKLQPYLIDLIVELNKSSEKDNDLNLLMPLLTKQLLFSFHETINSCFFAYRLSKKGIIPIENIIDKTVEKVEQSDRGSIYKRNLLLFFFPELIEKKPNYQRMIFNSLTNDEQRLIHAYLPNDIDKFKEIRDSGQPDDKISKAIYNDNIDELRSIFSEHHIDFNRGHVQPYIFDYFGGKVEKSFINYSAECGSIKCFKYFLLNHASIDMFSFGFAIYGKNTEIIHIVEQQMKENKNTNRMAYSNNKYVNLLLSPINITIEQHQYELFDWLFDQKITQYRNNNNALKSFAKSACSNGNAHTFITLIDNGFNIEEINTDFVIDTSTKGFYHLTKSLFSFYDCQNLINSLNSKIMEYIGFSNLSIFKLFFPEKKPNINYENFFLKSIELNDEKVFKYIIDELYEPTSENVKINAFNKALSLKSPTIFNYLEEKYGFDFPLHIYFTFLENCRSSGTFETSHKIIDSILKKSSTADFTKEFINYAKCGSVEMCQYIVDKKVKIDLFTVLKNYKSMVGITDIILTLIDKAPPGEREVYHEAFLLEAVKKRDKKLVDLLNQNKSIKSHEYLIEAVKNHDLNLVNSILNTNSNPSFVNQCSENGNALMISVIIKDLPIFKRLLSVPGIDPSICQRENMTPMLIAFKNSNYEMVNLILDFYGSEIHLQEHQIINALKYLMHENIGMLENKLKSQDSDLLKLIDRLMQIKNINLNFYESNNTFLTFACIVGNFELVKLIIDSNQIDPNLYELTSGDTPLIISINKSNTSIAKLFIENKKTNINAANKQLQTAFTIAVAQKNIDIINLLMNNDSFNPDESNINYAFYISNDEISQTISNIKNLNVNCIMFKSFKLQENGSQSYNNIFESMLLYAINQNYIEKAKIIISHPSFNPIKSKDKELIFHNKIVQNEELFISFMKKMDNNLELKSPDGKSLFDFVTKTSNENVIKYVMECEKFNPTKNELITAYNNVKNRANLGKSLNDIIEYDKKHNNYIESLVLRNAEENLIGKFSSGWGKSSDSNKNLWENGRLNARDIWKISVALNSAKMQATDSKQSVGFGQKLSGSFGQSTNTGWGNARATNMQEQNRPQNTWGNRGFGTAFGQNRAQNMQEQNRPQNTWGNRTATVWGQNRAQNNQEQNRNVWGTKQGQWGSNKTTSFGAASKPASTGYGYSGSSNEQISQFSPLFLIVPDYGNTENIHAVHQPNLPKAASARPKSNTNQQSQQQTENNHQSNEQNSTQIQKTNPSSQSQSSSQQIKPTPPPSKSNSNTNELSKSPRKVIQKVNSSNEMKSDSNSSTDIKKTNQNDLNQQKNDQMKQQKLKNEEIVVSQTIKIDEKPKSVLPPINKKI